MPTGAGKTVTGQAAAEGRPLWLVHRRELAAQAPGPAETVQGLLASGKRPDCDVLVADEAHRYGSEAAPQWHAVARHYPRVLGLTATPARHDGTPLGDLFEVLVVGADYSELLAGGWLVPARVVRPPEALDGLALDPVEAWQRYAGDRPGFAFFSRVEFAERFATALGDRCGLITGTTPDDARAGILERFRAGRLAVLANVQCLTEGVDVPGAEVCMLAGGVSHEGAYLQRVGRVLRPTAGKTEALVIDLPGCSHQFGLPDADREYSLTGKAIRAKVEALTVCRQCGCTHPASDPKCPVCGWTAPPKPVRMKVLGVALEEVIAHGDTKQLAIATAISRKGYSHEQLRAIYGTLLAEAAAKGYKPGWAQVRFKLKTGRWPTR
jgi:superfamily II DNA or RNA helicase